MSDNQLTSITTFILFFTAGLFWIYKGTRMLYQSARQERQIIWYNRFKLLRGIYWLFLGLGLTIIEVTNVAGVPLPFGNIGSYILFGMAILMILFGILSLDRVQGKLKRLKDEFF